jgi:hypothetical protein
MLACVCVYYACIYICIDPLKLESAWSTNLHILYAQLHDQLLTLRESSLCVYVRGYYKHSIPRNCQSVTLKRRGVGPDCVLLQKIHNCSCFSCLFSSTSICKYVDHVSSTENVDFDFFPLFLSWVELLNPLWHMFSKHIRKQRFLHITQPKNALFLLSIYVTVNLGS